VTILRYVRKAGPAELNRALSGNVLARDLNGALIGLAKPGYMANTLTPSVGDANSQTPEFKSFLVRVEKI